jgi:hypothetical protein
MGLHHFYWQGKERTASVDRRRKEVTILRFIDSEIIEIIGTHIIEWRELEKLRTHHAAIPDLITAAKDVIGEVGQR